jgi:hypothetical protein
VPDLTSATRRRSCLACGGRRSPLVSGMRRILEPHRHLDLHGQRFVFVTPGGEPHRNSNFGRRALRPAVDGTLDRAQAMVRLAPVKPGLTFHGLRHGHKLRSPSTAGGLTRPMLATAPGFRSAPGGRSRSVRRGRAIGYAGCDREFCRLGASSHPRVGGSGPRSVVTSGTRRRHAASCKRSSTRTGPCGMGALSGGASRRRGRRGWSTWCHVPPVTDVGGGGLRALRGTG